MTGESTPTSTPTAKPTRAVRLNRNGLDQLDEIAADHGASLREYMSITTQDMLLLSTAELEQLTGYKRPIDQLTELHRQGFSRARRDRLGRLVLERAHYDAVCAGQQQVAARPKIKPPTVKRA